MATKRKERNKRLRQRPTDLSPIPFTDVEEQRFVVLLDHLLAQLVKDEVMKHIRGDQHAPEEERIGSVPQSAVCLHGSGQ